MAAPSLLMVKSENGFDPLIMPHEPLDKQIFKRLSKLLRRIRQHQKLVLFVLAASALCAAIWIIHAPQTIVYDFSKQSSCQVSPKLFPQASAIEQKQPYNLKRPSSFGIGSFVVYSHRLCAVAHAAPSMQSTTPYRERLFGWAILGHTITIKTDAYPKLSKQPNSRASLPPDGVLKLELNQPDATFGYQIKAAQKAADCTLKGKNLRCELASLQLTYATDYDLQIVRRFERKEVAKVATAPIKTITPVSVLSSSIGPGATVQQKPDGIVIQTDKDIKTLGSVTVVVKNADKTEAAIPVTPAVAGKTITIKFGQELARKAAFELRIAAIEGSDGSGLADKSYTLAFQTSGGPKASGANIGTRNVPLGQTITVNFDQELLTTQDLGAAIAFTVHGKAAPATFSISGNKIHIKPQSDIPVCAPFAVKINGAVQSQFGVSGDSAWNFSSRTICYVSFSIGKSVRGQPITAYKFGTGENPIIYMGAMHGDELNSKTIMTEWFNELNANPNRLPARSLVVIPAVSPDGVAARSRLNARGIDLNRNFPAADWKTMVTSPESPTPTPAGGPNPLSEPESAAVAAYIRQTRPRMVFSFHSSAGIVEANEAGDSVTVANTYASKARYRAVPKSQSAGVFKYDTTGAMEDWMRTSLSSPAIVIELLSDTNSEFSRNRDALWQSTGL